MAPAHENSPQPEPLYQGELAQNPLPEILVTIHRYKVPGKVECRRGPEIKRIYLDGGRIIFAATNQISESVGDRLLASGRITREQYDESVRRFRERGARHGQTLVDMGILTREQLFDAVREQIQYVVWSIFAWPDGTVTFRPGRDKSMEFVKVDIPVPQAVMRGVRSMSDGRAVVARLGNKTASFEQTGEKVDELTLSADEQRLLEMVSAKRTLYELVSGGPFAGAVNAQVLYGFLTLKLIAPCEHRHVKVQVRTDGRKPV